ncbi:MAG: hypothetical protein EB154_09750, partial [Nitrosopumilaceae archaeon]|nr:hypothetical protein [Nitrosopumilaceae archaeon]
IRNELNRFEDRTGIPITLIFNLLVLLLSPNPLVKAAALIGAIMSGVETHVKKGSRKFTLPASAWNLIDQFIEENNFPYRRNYNKIITYRDANLASDTTGMTFQNRIYLQSIPSNNKELSEFFHEYVHTFQYHRYGQIVFIPVYVGEYLFELVRQRNAQEAYENIEFEDQAFDWEERFLDWLNARGIWVHKVRPS